MSYPDTISRLESQVRQLEEARMEEARERDRLRAIINRQEETIRACNRKIGELEMWNKDYREQIAIWKAKAGPQS